MDFNIPVLVGSIALAIIIAIVLGYFNLKNKKTSTDHDLPFDLSALLATLGEIENIESVEATMSKVTFKLKDTSKVDVEAIKALGASGIVETKGGFTFIFGSISQSIAKAIKEQL